MLRILHRPGLIFAGALNNSGRNVWADPNVRIFPRKHPKGDGVIWTRPHMRKWAFGVVLTSASHLVKILNLRFNCILVAPATLGQRHGAVANLSPSPAIRKDLVCLINAI